MSNTMGKPTILNYKKDDLIIKEGDFGVSIYNIIKGKVTIYLEIDEIDIQLNILGPGEVFGENVFLKKGIDHRNASIRAIEETELEVWHPDMLSKEYSEVPPILKYIADQLLTRLNKVNRLIPILIAQKDQREIIKKKDLWATKRRFYRKDVDIRVICQPVEATKREQLTGRITDMSLGGLGLEVLPKNLYKFPYKEGDQFLLNTMLPNGKELNCSAKILSINKGKKPGILFLGMGFTYMTDQVSKDLGFFLMPA